MIRGRAAALVSRGWADLALTDDRNDCFAASQQMYGALAPPSPKGYAAGDRAGLAQVGRKAGCLNGF